MNDRPTELERAFELARSGRCGCVEDIRRRLKAEGYFAAQVTGKALGRQLIALIKAAHPEKADARRDGEPLNQ